MRLRIPSKRRELDYFVDLYEQVRQLPGIDDVVINPTTGSVLLHYDEAQQGDLSSTLDEVGLFSLETASRQPPALVTEESPSGTGAHPEAAANDARLVVFLIMLGLSIYQLRRGQVMAPALTILLYALDLGTGFLRERASADPQSPAS